MPRELIAYVRDLLGDRYKVEEEIAVGGASRVFRARDPSGRVVWISILTVVPRWLASATGFKSCSADKNIWRDTQIVLEKNTPSSWYDVFTGEDFPALGRARRTLDVSKIFAHFPIALLTAEK